MGNQILIKKEYDGLLIPEGIDLSDSWILKWERTNSTFIIHLEFSIWPKSPHYSTPKHNEFTCYKKGVLKFFGVKELIGFVELDTIKPSTGADVEIDYGNINGFELIENRYKFETDFSDIEVVCDEIKMELLK